MWLVAVGVVLLFQGTIMAQWKISNPAAIWLTLPVLLFTTWLPMFYGVLQGQQNFLWMGWSMLANGVGRLAIAAFAVLVLHYYAPGMVLGMLGGLTVALVIAIWPTRSLWLSSPQPFEWRSLLRQIIPLTLGFGAYQFLLTADTMLVRAYFSERRLRVLRERRDAGARLDVAGRPAGGGHVSEDRPRQGEGGEERPDGRGADRDRDPGRGRGNRFVGAGSVGGDVHVQGQLRAGRLRAAALVCLGGGAAGGGQRAAE